ncbi:hypothetical protein O0L34_g12771 [Tuta absoluta]|nr:hypothetical protein O0L34_g12771 [Tuta absoluta]
MEVDQEVTPVTTKKKGVVTELPNEGPSPKQEGKKSDTEDPKPRIVLTFRSEKAGAKSSTMKIVPTEEKHEEISPRRSNRTRAAKYDSEEEGDHPITPKKEKGQHTSENDEASDSSHTAVKRSTRRRSKEFDNVIANAIARKEKSYNETPTPSRPSRRIKPTAKVLANEELRIGFETQNNARLGVQDKSPEEGVRTRRSIRGRQTVQEEPKIEIKEEDTKVKEEVGIELKDEIEDDEENSSEVMKLKHLCELGLQAIKPEDIKDEESESTSQDAIEPSESTSQEAIELDDDTADEEIDDDSEVISKLLEADAESVSDSDDEFLCSGENSSRTRRSTRSTRQHSSFKNDSGRSSPAHGDDDQSAPLRRSSRKRRTISPTLAEVIGYDVPHNRNKKLRSTATPEADGEEISEPAPGEEGSEAACPPDDSAVVATCCCETPSNVYPAPSELTEPVFCQAIELVDGVRVGCSHGAAKQPDGSYAALLRAGPRAPYFLACKLHTAQFLQHMCCPACGLFCSQGYFYQCSLGHFFHLECGLPYNMVKPPPGCPHCGVRSYRWTPANTNCHKVKLQMHCSNKRIFLPEQREQCTPAYAGFTTLKESQLDSGPVIPEDLLPSTPIDLKRLCEKPDMEEDPTDAAEALCDAILAGEDVDSLIPKIIAGAGLNISLPSMGGGTVLHAAAKRGHLSAVHLLHTAGADLNCTAASKTPLMVAILALLDKTDIKSPKKNKSTIDIVKDENGEQVKEVIEDGKESDVEEVKSVDSRPDEEELLKVIRYLIAAGCDVNLPGPDGMTALHMAAQYGGTEVCKIILNNTDVNVDARDQGGWTPLVWAAENLHADTVRLLLANGANASAADSEGNCVIHWCALAGATRPLQLLLDSAPDTVNALNAHTDTPLHVAARQGHYACVIMLLARGARTDAENTAGEFPLDVCSREGQCYSAISLNMQMTVSVSEKLRKRRLLTSDISRGREELPIPCINEVDSAALPEDFVYITTHVMPKSIAIDNTIQSSQGCKCEEDCSTGGCECCVLAVKRWWSRGRLSPDFPYHDPPMLFECNQTCACNMKKCTNSVITRLCSKGSVFVRAAVFRVGGARGWGLRTQSRIAKGSPVATYVGELLSVEHADTRAADQYMFALDVKQDLIEQLNEKTQLCVDAAQYGGAARFINHSCRPNLAPVRVFTSTRDLRLPVVALFAASDIPAGDELTFDYGDKFWRVKSKWLCCECGAPDCRYPNKREQGDKHAT